MIKCAKVKSFPFFLSIHQMQAGFLYNFFFWTLANFFGAMEISCALLCELEESYHKVVKLLKKKSELEKKY